MSKAKQNKKSKIRSKLYNTPVLGFRDNIVFTTQSVWAYYVLAERPYDFLSYDTKVALANSTIQGLGSLALKATEPVDCHLLTNTTPFDPIDWENQMYRVYSRWNSNEEILEEEGGYIDTGNTRLFKKFIEKTSDDMLDEEYQKRSTYLGIKLYDRKKIDFSFTSLIGDGVDSVFESLKTQFSRIIDAPGEKVTKKEELRAVEAENTLYQIISTGGLRARRPTAETLLLAMKSRYYPFMPTPRLMVDKKNRMNFSDIVYEFGGEIHVKQRYLHFKQVIGGESWDGFRSTLTFYKFPKDLSAPTYLPFFSNALTLPYNCFSRFTLLPTLEMKARYERKKDETEDEIKNLAESGQRMGAALADKLSDLDSLEESLEDDRLPWIQGTYRVTITASSPEKLQEQIAAIIQEFAHSETVLIQSVGDQLDCFREEQIGGETILKDFRHTTNLALLATMGINHGSDLGDPITGYRL